MILRQVGEHRRVKVAAVHPSLIQRMGGHLHHRILAALRHHQRKHALQIIRIRRGVPRRQHPLPNHILDGADQPHLVSAGFQHRFQHIGHAGFAVGAGDAQQMQLARRPTKPVGAHHRPRMAGGFHQNLVFQPQIALHNHRQCAVRQRFFRKRVSVRSGSANAHKHPARFHLARVTGDARHLVGAGHGCAGVHHQFR